MIYLDNAATTKMTPEAKAAMEPYFDDVYGNASSLYSFGQVAKERLEAARKVVADCLGADAGEIYFTSGGSESDNWAICPACKFGAMKNKKHIITSAFEHHAILHTLEEKKERGFSRDLFACV